MTRFFAKWLSDHRSMVATVMVAGFTWWLRHHPVGFEGLVFDDDARQHVYWTIGLHETGLFINDPLTRFASSFTIAPPGYQALYWAGLWILDPLPFSQWLSLVLLVVVLWQIDRLLLLHGVAAPQRLFCNIIFLLYLVHNPVHNVMGGFQRSFAFPLLLASVLLTHGGRLRGAAWILPLQGLLYPAILPNTVALAAVEFLRRLRRDRFTRTWLMDAWVWTVAGLVTLVLIKVSYGFDDKAFLGPIVTLDQARTMPEFYPGGRSVFFRDSLWVYFLTGRSGIGLEYLSIFVILAGVIVFTLGRHRMRWPPLFAMLIGTSLVLFIIAHLVLFRLYLPSRFTYHTLSVALILFIGVNLGGFWECIKEKASHAGMRLPRVSRATAGALAAFLLLGYGLVQSLWVYRADPRLVAVDGDDLQLYEFISGKPKDWWVAGHPLAMDNIPLLTRRPVVADAELALPYLTHYYAQVKGRLTDTLRAYYAIDWHTIEEFVTRYRVNLIVVRKSDFAGPSSRWMYFEPFQDMLEERVGANARFVLADPPKSLVCFENSRYVALCTGDGRLGGAGAAPGP